MPELFHLWQEANRPGGALMVGSIGALFLAMLVISYLVYRRRLHPVVVWAILSLGFFGFSQCVPENRNRRGQFIVMAVIGSAVLTLIVVRVARRTR